MYEALSPQTERLCRKILINKKRTSGNDENNKVRYKISYVSNGKIQKRSMLVTRLTSWTGQTQQNDIL